MSAEWQISQNSLNISNWKWQIFILWFVTLFHHVVDWNETEIMSLCVNLKRSWNWINITDSISSKIAAATLACVLLRKYV